MHASTGKALLVSSPPIVLALEEVAWSSAQFDEVTPSTVVGRMYGSGHQVEMVPTSVGRPNVAAFILGGGTSDTHECGSRVGNNAGSWRR
jgi:hypothetical protein